MKIVKIINSCNDCEYCIYATGHVDNYTHFAICGYNPMQNFLLSNAREPLQRFELQIPAHCPLEDYKGDRGTYEEEIEKM